MVKNKRGFTLVELLVVIIILAIFALLAIPRVIKVVNRARVGSFVVEANSVIKTAKNAYGDSVLSGDEEGPVYCYTVDELIRRGLLHAHIGEISGVIVLDMTDVSDTKDAKLFAYISKDGFYARKLNGKLHTTIKNDDVVIFDGNSLFKDCTASCDATANGASIRCGGSEITVRPNGSTPIITPVEPEEICDLETTEFEFDYTGEIQSFKAPCKGAYQLEVWGAQGGKCRGTNGGKGGYAVGSVVLNKDQMVYIGVGGQAVQFNGGGRGTAGTSNPNGGRGQNGVNGGGATHMALVSGELADIGYTEFVDNNKGLIVAGGGGGSGGQVGWEDDGSSAQNIRPGGYGGGLNGGSSSGGSCNGVGGTQSGSSTAWCHGGAGFGVGGTQGSGGGGGFYGGGGGYFGAGGGGSSWIGGVINGSTTANQQTGNGKAKITYIGAAESINNTCLAVNESVTFEYTGTMQEFTAVCPGRYKLEGWGAQGGKNGGRGGYAAGIATLAADAKIYIGVGERPAYTTGGYNGGGAGGGDGSGGGGATHFARTRSILKNTAIENVYLIAAGGGGGMNAWNGHSCTGGYGGGVSGGRGQSNDGNANTVQNNGGEGATQVTGAKYGLGGNGDLLYHSARNSGGGGGGYYGGYGGQPVDNYRAVAAGGGGSSWVGGVTDSETTADSRTGHGFAKITYLGT